MKQGMTYTLSFLLFGLAMFALSILYFEHSQFNSSQYTRLSYTQKIQDLDTSIEHALLRLFQQHNAPAFALQDGFLTITEPFPSEVQPLQSRLEAFAEAVQTDFPTINISIGLYQGAYIHWPLNITYQHLTNNSILLSFPNSVQSLNATLSFMTNITSCTTDLQAGGNLKISMGGTSAGNECILAAANGQQAYVHFTAGGKGVSAQLSSVGAQFQLRLESNETATVFFALQDDNVDGKIELPLRISINDSPAHFSRQHQVSIPLQS